MNTQLQKWIDQFKQSTTVKALDKYFQEKSMMEICGVDRDENTHSNFLAWLFQNEITGKAGCGLLLDLLGQQRPNIKNVRVTREDFVIDYYKKDNGTIVHTNKCDSNGQEITGRADIVIDITTEENNPLKIIIENKIDSEEICKWEVFKNTKDKKGNIIKQLDKDNSLWQTQFYFDYYKEKATYVFLTLSGKEDAHCKKFKHITYQELLDGVIVPLLGHLEVTSPLSPVYIETIQKINEYVKVLGIRYSQDEIMAADPYLKQLIERLQNENHTIVNELYNLYECYYLGKTNNNNTVAKKDMLEFWNTSAFGKVTIGDILRLVFKIKLTLYLTSQPNNQIKNGRDHTTYKDKGNNEKIKGKNALFVYFTSKYIEKYKTNENKLPSIDHLQQVFPASLHGKTSSAQNSQNNDNNIITNYKKNKDYKDLNNFTTSVPENKFFVHQSGWDGTGMMSRLIRYVKTIPELKCLEILEIPAFLK